jgi:hypothetical protein
MAKAKKRKPVSGRKPARATSRTAAVGVSAPVQKHLEQSVKALLKLQESEMETLLGQELALTRRELENNKPLSAALIPPTGLPEDTAKLAAAPEWLRKLGQRFLEKFSAQMYSLVCDKSDADNAKVVKAIGEGTEKLALLLVGVLMANFAWLPAIASVVAVIIARRVVEAGHGALCQTWKETLPA